VAQLGVLSDAEDSECWSVKNAKAGRVGPGVGNGSVAGTVKACSEFQYSANSQFRYPNP